ncbi:MAG: acyl-CoA desaturase [Rhodopirellula sp.]|nr:acyl-CoA desaturase [Rhodopirellula sp.]
MSQVNATIATKKSHPVPSERWAHGVDWPVAIWIGLIHVGALAAPLAFTWKAVLLAVALSWITGSLGVCLGYHRLLTHGSFKTYKWVWRLFGWVGSLAGEGPPVNWVANHRQHHQFSDKPGDPHSPNDGRWWSHMIWLFPQRDSARWQATMHRYAPDLLKDPFMRMLDKTFIWWHLAFGALLFGLGWTVWDLSTGISFVVWGMFVRLVYVLHITWAVNSASHIWGYRNYQTTDNSRNLWWVGLVAFGEGWHNNHHAHQRSARHGHRWWEIDTTYMVIRWMELAGLAWDVVSPPSGNARHGSPPKGESTVALTERALEANQEGVADTPEPVYTIGS